MYSNDAILDENITDEELASLSPEERDILNNMLQELMSTGSSNTLRSLWYQDFEEIPVDLDTFLDDPDYLGNSMGSTLYPFWRGILKKLFAPDSKYYECVLSGAIGIGKTTVADVGIAYMLHKLLCMRDPQSYYGLSKTSIMTINFFNVTKTLSYGVSYSKLQAMLMSSPWFLEHGKLVGNTNQVYVPGKNIQINVGSNERHALGQDVFCVTGDTKIWTENGIVPIELLDGREVRVYQIDGEEDIQLSEPCDVELTSYTDELYEIELEDGGVIRCTPSHKVMLSDGTYKRAGELTIDDEIKYFTR